jgi:hypothetical protein
VLPNAAATVIAAGWAELTSGTLPAPINVTETGGVRNTFVWTNTLPNGTAGGTTANAHCLEWTFFTPGGTPNFGHIGQSNMANSLWTAVGRATCNFDTLGLYCFEQG